MPHEIYQYSASVTPNQRIAPDTLHQEIARLGLTPALAGITVQGSGAEATAFVTFMAALSPEEHAALDALVAAHQGQPMIPREAPRELDGKPIVVTTPGTVGWLTWFHGAGDSVDPLDRAGGQAIEMTIATVGDHEVEWRYAEPLELHDGQVQLEGLWSVRDKMDFFVRMPATPATENLEGTGNATRVEVFPGLGIYVYVPVPPGTGDWDIDLATAVPVPGDRQNPTGYWECDYETGEVRPSAPGQGHFNLFSVELAAYFMRGMPLGAKHGVIDVDVYRTDWLHPNWFIKAVVHKAVVDEDEPSRWAGWMLGFRKANTLQ
jgi:hypothetical protein